MAEGRGEGKGGEEKETRPANHSGGQQKKGTPMSRFRGEKRKEEGAAKEGKERKDLFVIGERRRKQPEARSV